MVLDIEQSASLNLVRDLCLNCNSQSDSYERLGYCALGPLVVGFSSWLVKRLEHEDCSKLFFLARDGSILMKALNLLDYELPPKSYLYVSRHAVQVPAIHYRKSFVDCVRAISFPKELTLRDFMVRFGMPPDSLDEALKNAGFRPDELIEGCRIENNAIANKVFRAFETSIRSYADCQNELIIDYLNSNGFDGNVAIVDIGWFGNIQRSLELIMPHVNIRGYYIGLQDGSEVVPCSGTKEAYLFSPGINSELKEKELAFNSLFEVMCSANHGTTICYTRNNGRVYPVLAELSEVELKTSTMAERFREGALQFALDWKQVTRGELIQLNPREAFENLVRIGLRPTLEEAEMFGDWLIEDSGRASSIAAPRTISHYIMHPADYRLDLNNCRWGIGFNRRLFRLPLPYYALRNLLRVAKG